MIEPRYDDGICTVYHGDCAEVLGHLADDSVDAVVTDPPYGLGFMGKEWDSPGGPGDFPMRRFDALNMVNTGASRQGGRQRSTEDWAKRQARDARTYQEWCEKWARECLRVLKPGGHLLAFGGTRTYHRLASAIEDAGFELRDCIAWLYGSGFPKSLDLSKAIDRSAGVEREVIAEGKAVKRMIPGADQNKTGSWIKDNGREFVPTDTAPATDDAKRWHGWGTALKPAHEPIVLARKSTIGTVAANVLAHGTGGLNIDACRIDAEPRTFTSTAKRVGGILNKSDEMREPWTEDRGRWPTNVALDDPTANALDRQTGVLTSGANPTKRGSDKVRDAYGDFKGQEECEAARGADARGADAGGASRFFPVFRYEAKAGDDERPRVADLTHPTVKPVALLRWLVRLVTPSGGLVLDPFLGSGTTAEACVREGLRCIGIEREEDYMQLIEARLGKGIQIGFAL